MPTSPSAHGAPRARRDPIVTPAAALAVIDLARSWPPRDEIIAFLLDERHRGMGVIVDLTEIRAPADVLAVAELLGETGASHTADGRCSAESIVIASVRLHEASVLDDVDLWEQLSNLLDSYGITLLEWFVITPAAVMCPRDVLGEPDRWPR
jgi:hypothetical protein